MSFVAHFKYGPVTILLFPVTVKTVFFTCSLIYSTFIGVHKVLIEALAVDGFQLIHLLDYTKYCEKHPKWTGRIYWRIYLTHLHVSLLLQTIFVLAWSFVEAFMVLMLCATNSDLKHKTRPRLWWCCRVMHTPLSTLVSLHFADLKVNALCYFLEIIVRFILLFILFCSLMYSLFCSIAYSLVSLFTC